MAFVLADRVRETSTTTGTGTLSLAGAVQSYQTFSTAIGNTNTTYYAIAHQSANEFEVGLGTVSTSGSNTLARTTVLKSSNSNSAVDFSAGTKDVFVTYPSEKAVTTSDAQTLTNKTIDASQLSGTVANARLDAQLQDVAGLAVTNGNFIVGDGSNFVAESGATARTSLGLGTVATKAYEDGTFSPVISFGGGTTGIGYSVQESSYTKVGRLCVVTGRVALSSKGSSSGDVAMTLPFTVGAFANGGQVNLAYGTNFNTYSASGVTLAASQGAASAIMFSIDGGSALTNTHFNNNTDFMFTLTFLTA